MAYLTAGDVKLIDPLKKPLAGYNQTAQTSLANALGAAKTGATSSAKASGRTMGNYVDESLGRANLNASQGIENSIAGSLGETSYKDLMAEREHQRKLQMARQIGDLMSPSLAQQILGGLNTGANLALKGSSLYNSLTAGQPKTPYVQTSPISDTADIYGYSYPDPSSYGSYSPARYGNTQPFGAMIEEPTYPNMMRAR